MYAHLNNLTSVCSFTALFFHGSSLQFILGLSRGYAAASYETLAWDHREHSLGDGEGYAAIHKTTGIGSNLPPQTATCFLSCYCYAILELKEILKTQKQHPLKD